jgi:hypothetical protein
MAEDPEWQRKWGDRIIGDPKPPIDESLAAQSDEAPVGIVLSGQELAKLYCDHTSPRVFSQFLLEQLKFAGCPAVSGSVVFKLNRGKVFRLKSQPGDFDFRYMWVPPMLVAAMGMDGDDKESVRVN